MFTFDSFTLIPTYSDIISRNEIDVSTTICNIQSSLPIINANMLSICTETLIDNISNKYNSFSSYHRFFENENCKKKFLQNLLEKPWKNIPSHFWMSLGTKPDEYEFVGWLNELGIKNVIVDVNHGHSKMVKDMIVYIKNNYKGMKIMAGNVSSNDGISFLANEAGADIIKIGNSFGSACSTILATAVGVHPMHVVKEYREKTNDWNTQLCVDGGIRFTADICKSLIYGNMVMLGKMFAGCDESYGEKVDVNGEIMKTYYGNASLKTKTNANLSTKYVEGISKFVPYTGNISNTLDNVNEGLQSAFSFMGARNLSEYQQIARHQILEIKS